MTRLSGWCSAPLGAAPMCAGCRVLDCEHSCHEKPVVDRDSASYMGATSGVSWENEASPGSVLGGPLHEALDSNILMRGSASRG